MEISLTEDDKKIEKFIKENSLQDSYSFFISPKFVNLIADFYKYENYKLVIKDKDEIIAYFPLVFIKSKIFKNHLISVPFTGHGGGFVIKKESNKKEVLELFLKEIKKIAEEKKVNYLIIRGPREEQINDFLNLGFKEPYVDYNFFLDLNKPLEEIRKGIDKKLRNIIKSAENKNIKVYEKSNEEGLNYLYKLHLKTMKRLGSPPKSKSFFTTLLNSNYYKIYIAEFEGKIISASSFFQNEDYASWYDGVSDEKYRYLNGNSLILWKFIEFNHQKIKTLDLGTSREDSNHYNYKMQWNPKLIKASKLYYFFNEKKSEIIDPRNKKFNFFSFIWRNFIPLPISRIIGPKIRKSTGS